MIRRNSDNLLKDFIIIVKFHVVPIMLSLLLTDYVTKISHL